MSLFDDFIASPSVEILFQCTKTQLLELSEKYQVPLSNTEKRLKDTTLAALIEGLVVQELLPETAAEAKPPQSSIKEIELQIYKSPRYVKRSLTMSMKNCMFQLDKKS